MKPDLAEKHANNPLFLEVMAEALALQDRFAAGPVYAETGKGYLKSAGVEELKRIKEVAKQSEKRPDSAHSHAAFDSSVVCTFHLRVRDSAKCGAFQAKNALHKPTSDGHEPSRILWETNHVRAMTPSEAIDLCRRCHRLAPFCFYNGNTFAAIARAVISRLGLDERQAFIMRSLAGHIVAGEATEEEVRAFQAFSDSYSA